MENLKLNEFFTTMKKVSFHKEVLELPCNGVPSNMAATSLVTAKHFAVCMACPS